MVKKFIIVEILRAPKISANPPNPCISPTRTTGGIFKISSSKFYVPVITFYINDSIRFLENIKQGFKRTISWNKYRS